MLYGWYPSYWLQRIRRIPNYFQNLRHGTPGKMWDLLISSQPRTHRFKQDGKRMYGFMYSFSWGNRLHPEQNLYTSDSLYITAIKFLSWYIKIFFLHIGLIGQLDILEESQYPNLFLRIYNVSITKTARVYDDPSYLMLERASLIVINRVKFLSYEISHAA